MDDSTSKIQKNEFFILGITNTGMQFRPSDWSERLSGAISCFQPDTGRQSHLHYSRFVQPIVINGIRSVVVDHALREIEPLAYHFVIDFAKDNDLQIVDACLLPEPEKKP
ncbi:MAG: hypothetical protein K0R08_1555 [Solimicrobium sp.]|jgi:hypothetical protein|nr:hypothetical protein [Solimicrobium sp.]